MIKSTIAMLAITAGLVTAGCSDSKTPTAAETEYTKGVVAFCRQVASEQAAADPDAAAGFARSPESITNAVLDVYLKDNPLPERATLEGARTVCRYAISTAL